MVHLHGTTITLKPAQMSDGTHKISLTYRQIKHFNDALKKRRGVQIDFLKAAIANMIKSGGIFPLLAAIPALISAAAPAVAKAAALGAVDTAAGMALKKATGKGYKKGKGSKTTRNHVFMVQGKRHKNTRNSLLMTQESVVPMSSFDLIDAARALKIKIFRGVFMRDQLQKKTNNAETDIINLDNSSGPETHWVAYAIDPHGIIYFDSYGLAPPKEFMHYIKPKEFPIFYSTLPTQQLNDPPICGREVLNV